MHGMVNRGLQTYINAIFGADVWEDVCNRAGLSFQGFETMLRYDDAITEAIVAATAQVLGRSRSDVLEDFGTFVVADENLSTVRRLLRFGGEDYVEFLQSLEDIKHVFAVVMPDLEVPEFTLSERGQGQFRLAYRFSRKGFGPILLGLLRGMADHYGVLIVIDHQPGEEGESDRDHFDISLLQLDWTQPAGMPQATGGPA